MIKLKGKKVLVYGMGISGQSACKLLHKEGACVSFFDDEGRFGDFFACEKDPLKQKYDLVVVSPGIKVRGNHIISHFLVSGVEVISELDLGFLFSKGSVVGITGTNGKTTVTSLVGKIFQRAGFKTFVCGNIGLPLTAVADKTDKDSVIVCEVSNFQLELSKYFAPDFATILNLAPDHIDRHGSMEEYVRCKRKILTGKREQKVLLNFDDELSRVQQNSKNVTFFSKEILKNGVFVKNYAIYHNKNKIISLNDIPLFGEKNLENVLASVGVAVKFKIKSEIIKSAIADFHAPRHRLEYLGKVNGADVFDDSKATNISASLSAISSLGERGLVVLLGGLNKDCQFDEIFDKGLNFENILCFGQAGQEIFDCAEKYGYKPLLFSTMKSATYYAKSNAEEGQKILLAPACASFDEFSSYAVRGEIFKEIMFENLKQIEISKE